MKSFAKPLLQEATSRLFVEGNLEAVSRYFSEDYVVHLTETNLQGGHALVQSAVALYRQAFSELSIDITVFVEDPDRVSWQRTMRGTHTGAFKGFPGTGQTLVWNEMVVSRLVDGMIAEEWIVTDLAERLLLARKTMSRNRKSLVQKKIATK